MTGAAAESIALVLLVASLAVAVLRPLGWSEAVFAVPAAVVLVALGIVPWHAMTRRLAALGPTVAFLALILLFGHLCAEEGVFDYLGSVAARASGGSATRLLGMVVVLAAAITAVLTLDATVVLLTPVVLRTASQLRLRGRPHVYACQQLANAGSLLLPVSNLTNLLAFGDSGLSFGRFAALMALPWLVVCALQWLALRTFFRADLADTAQPQRTVLSTPRYGLAVLAVTVAGFVVTSSVHLAPAWAAAGGCLLLAVPRLARRQTTPVRLLGEASLGFCLFVLALGVVVEGVTQHGLGSALHHALAHGTSLAALIGIAALAAVLANVLNNIPATLLLAPLAGSPAGVLAVLLGVNIGPNLTYAGSLATLLWRRLLPARNRPRAAEFHLLGVLAVPPILVAATVALWLSARVLGT